MIISYAYAVATLGSELQISFDESLLADDSDLSFYHFCLVFKYFIN